MNKQDIQKIIDETTFSMEVEGYILPIEEKETIRKVLNGNISFTDQLKKYIDDAKLRGGLSNASYQ